MKKLDCILLVDDNRATNLLHRKIIERGKATDHIQVARTGDEALDFLAHREAGGQVFPDLIFVDINMPRMDGWEFLEEYCTRHYQDHRTVVIMLSGSLNEADEERANGLAVVSGFMQKPLTNNSFSSLMERYFHN